MDIRALLAGGIRQEHLKIGECIFTTRDLLIVTVLGSCVSATFHHPLSRAAAMFHAMLPDSRQSSGPVRHPCTFADLAVARIMERFRRLGLPAAEIRVRLFGGAGALCPEEQARLRGLLDVGSKNVEAARAALTAQGLRVLSEDVLGPRGRKVLFHTGSGRSWLRDVNAGPDDPFQVRD
ncbi:chemotaxis protein CheD [Desulfovibrio aminophilus]|nr:chemotaxis protein CheD [Desulfovibrio aminophilus]MCM0753878.1 chemotaxis protein CheD [Desulfovibrio aminophilus]